MQQTVWSNPKWSHLQITPIKRTKFNVSLASDLYDFMPRVKQRGHGAADPTSKQTQRRVLLFLPQCKFISFTFYVQKVDLRFFLFRPNENENISRFGAFFNLFFCRAKINFLSCSSGVEKKSFFQPWSLAPYRYYCLFVEFVRLDNGCKSPPLDPASTHHLPARDKVRCSPNYESSLGESCCRVSALSPCPLTHFPKHDWQLRLTLKNLHMMTVFNGIPPLVGKLQGDRLELQREVFFKITLLWVLWLHRWGKRTLKPRWHTIIRSSTQIDDMQELKASDASSANQK